MSVLSRFTAPTPAANLQASTDKFSSFLTTFLDDVRSGDYQSENKTIKLIAHSHLSAVSRAVVDQATDLSAMSFKLELIMADLPIGLEFETFLNDLEPLLHQGDEKLSFRWANNPLLLDAHEQMILGGHSSWSGDTLKRASGNAYHVDMFEAADPDTIRLGEMAFSAMWVASSEVPSHRLKRIIVQDNTQKQQFFSQIADKIKANHWADTLLTQH